MGLITWKIRFLLSTVVEEQGQDLVEYALTITILALGVVAGTDTVSSAINTIFRQLGEILYTALT